MNRVCRRLANLSLVFISIAIALLFLNLVCGLLETKSERDAFFEAPSDENPYVARFRYNPLLGKNLAPNARYNMGKFHILIETNSKGMRYHEIVEKQAFRVALLGDSFTWGLGVNTPQRFSDIIEERYGFEMLNFGVPGYGPVEYYLELPQAMKFKPDLVILMFCLVNDFSDNLTNFGYQYYRPYATLDQGKLAITGYPIPNIEEYREGLKTGFKRFAIGRFLYLHFSKLMDSPTLSWNAPPLEGLTDFDDETIDQEPQSKCSKQAEAINEALLKMIRDRLAKENVLLIIFADPEKNPLDGGEKLRELEREASRLQIPLITPKTDFVVSDFLQDGHWNAHGHQKVADILGPVVQAYAQHALPNTAQ